MAGADVARALELVVHPDVTTQSLDRKQVRSIFTARQLRWEDGRAIQVFVLPEESNLHQEFSKQVLDLYPYQLRGTWEKVRYTGMGRAPIIVASEEEMRRKVADTPGAIGYLGKVQSHDKIRPLPLR